MPRREKEDMISDNRNTLNRIDADSIDDESRATLDHRSSVVHIQSEPMTMKDLTDDCPNSPSEYVQLMLERNGFLTAVEPFSREEMSYFEPYQESHMPRELVRMVTENDVSSIDLLHQTSPHFLRLKNLFGESLLHLACRWGLTDMVRYLVDTANLPLNVRNSWGRTPLHEACMSIHPNFEVIELILERAPELILFLDNRGHNAFTCIREVHWEAYIQFLSENRHLLCLPSQFRIQQPLISQAFGSSKDEDHTSLLFRFLRGRGLFFRFCIWYRLSIRYC